MTKIKSYADAVAAAVLGTASDTATNNTVYGAKAYSDANKAEIIGANTDQATANTIYGAKAYADAAISDALVSAYKPGGSKTAAELTNSLLVAANEGYMYNLSDDLTITSSNKALFVENAEGTYPAGSNVTVINTGTEENPVYLFDMMPGQITMTDISTSTIDEWFE